MKIASIKIQNFRSLANIEIKKPDNFIVLAGKNGTGKTSLLEAIYLCLEKNAQSNNRIIDELITSGKEESSIEIDLEFTDKEVLYFSKKLNELKEKNLADLSSNFSNQVTIKTVLSRSTKSEGSQSKSYFSNNHGFEAVWNSDIKFVFFFNAYRKIEIAEEQIFSQPSQSFQKTLPEMEIFGVDRLRDPMNIRPTKEISKIIFRSIFEQFKQSAKNSQFTESIIPLIKQVNKLIDPKEIGIPNLSDPENKIKYPITIKGKKKHSLLFLSAGEMELVMLGSYLWSIKDPNNIFKPIILIDEPELHLHPTFVRRLSQFIVENILSEDITTNIIISTHSADFLDGFPLNTFQIIAKKPYLLKAEGADDKKEILNLLGAKYGPEMIVDNLVLTESNLDTIKQIPDSKIYQRIIDPEIKKSYFHPSGGYPKVYTNQNFLIKLFSSLGITGKNIYGIIDKGAGSPEKPKNIIENGIYDVYNIFLYQQRHIAKLLEELTGKKIKSEVINDEIKKIIISKETGKRKTDCDGKKICEVFFGNLKKKYSLKLEIREFYERLLDKIEFSNLPSFLREKLKMFRP